MTRRFYPLTMEQENKHSADADLYNLIGWLHTNRKQLIGFVSVILVVGAAAGLWFWNKSQHEVAAGEALSNVKLPADALEHPTPALAEPYLKVANEYPGTSGGARALLMAGGVLFEAGNYTEAQSQFDRFLRDYPGNPMANEALLGVASSLEGQGKTNDAIARYDDLINHHVSDTTSPQAKAALAGLYATGGKPEQALHLYEDLMRNYNNSTWGEEASIGREDLLAKYPALAKAPAINTAAVAPAVTMPPSVPVKP